MLLFLAIGNSFTKISTLYAFMNENRWIALKVIDTPKPQQAFRLYPSVIAIRPLGNGNIALRSVFINDATLPHDNIAVNIAKPKSALSLVRQGRVVFRNENRF